MTFSKAILALAALSILGVAQAQSISGTDIKKDFDNPLYSASFSVLASTPFAATTTLGLKTQDGFTGVGVQGMTDGEIDWRNGLSESITVDLTNPSAIASITLGLLFNGPEYNDVQEVAHITVNGSQSYFLKTTGTENVAGWYLGANFLGSVNYIAGAGTLSGDGGAIKLSNPFGNTVVDTIRFAATQGLSGGGCGASGVCTNQSDYNIVNVTAVPEPQTYALMLAGLGAMAFVARRRRPTV